ncbi:MAG: type II toxin-antitoxin system prevent-host-death family antitoxin [Gemmatimonas sp.]|nr:type II toxin-antitoxin system prevent-host-death family antitoxin [Gemmatimonas sp.]
MKKTYSTYEAKARLSEILRQVRERGETVTVTYHGKPVAEIRPVSADEGTRLEKRVRDLERRGVVVPSEAPPSLLRPVVRKPGALDRFLRERDS